MKTDPVGVFPIRYMILRKQKIVELSVIVILSAWANLSSAQPGPTAVVLCPVVERTMPATIRLVGSIQPDKQAVVASEVGGPIAEFAAEQGQFLRRGDVICRIDPINAQLSLDGAAAQLESLQQKLAELENGTRPEEVRRVRAAMDEAQAMVDKWEFERSRMESLSERDAGTPWERHDTDMEYLAAQRRLDQAKAMWETAENGPRAETVAQARADLAAQRTIVLRLKRDLEKTEIRSPFNGFVVSKRTEVGEWIDEGGAVCEMIDIETVRVRVDVPEQAVPFASVGSAASIVVDALQLAQPAKIARVIQRGDSTSRTFPIEIDLANADHKFLPGMFAWAHVPAGPAGARIMVNKDAIKAQGINKTLFVIRPGPDGSSMAMPMPVTTGLELESDVEITSGGLVAGDMVVCRANERLYGPTPVIPQALSAQEATASGDQRPDSSLATKDATQEKGL